MMNIGDLDYLQNASSIQAIVGSAAASQVVLNLNGNNLVLSSGDAELYRTTLSGTPSSTQLVFENLPATRVVISTKNADGTVTTSSTVATGVAQADAPLPIGLRFSNRFLLLF